MTRTTIPTSGGAGAGAAVDQIGSDNYPMGKLVDGSTGGTEGIPGSTAKGLLVNPSNQTSTAAAVTSVNDQATNIQLLAANANRKGVLLHNNSPSTLYIKYGGTASIAAGGWSVKIPADAYWEMPMPVNTEALHGIWSSDSTGYAQITEL